MGRSANVRGDMAKRADALFSRFGAQKATKKETALPRRDLCGAGFGCMRQRLRAEGENSTEFRCAGENYFTNQDVFIII